MMEGEKVKNFEELILHVACMAPDEVIQMKGELSLADSVALQL